VYFKSWVCEISCVSVSVSACCVCRVGDSGRGARVEVSVVHILHEAAGLRCVHVFNAKRPNQQHHSTRHW
jgi:hypothetical protein